jgi:signal transduction histidine kinase
VLRLRALRGTRSGSAHLIPMDRFSVDTQLFRELGELLVGRDSTALTELVKNAYDADATTVQVVGRGVENAGRGSITVVDDGVGMTAEQFRRGYLTIAGRGKDSGDRRSLRFGRRFTGEKGIGRLATHKLAHRLEVQSIPGETDHARGRSRVHAEIDWDAIEQYETLADIGDDGLRVDYARLPKPRQSGTTVHLSTLRHSWSERDLADFVIELDVFQPPDLLVAPLPADLVPEPVLLGRVPVRNALHEDPFRVRLEGDFEVVTDLWTQVRHAANWIVEIDSRRDGIRIGIAPTPATLHDYPEARPLRVDVAPLSTEQPAFVARIIAREGARGTRRTRDFASKAAGIRVFMEGFRVAPYGEQGNDWLGFDRAYARRSPRLQFDLPGLPIAPVRGEGLRGLPNNAYVGAVLLTHAGAEGLEMLVNREGFIETRVFEDLRGTVRTAINLLTRLRAQQGAAEGSPKSTRNTIVLLSDELRVRDGLVVATKDARALRVALAGIGPVALGEDADALAADLDGLAKLAENAVADRSMLRILAAVGTQMAAFVHETQGLVGAAHSVSRSLGTLADRNPDRAEQLLNTRQLVDDLANRIDNQAGYLSEVTSVSVRRRRQRLAVYDRLQTAIALLEPSAARIGIDIVVVVDADTRTTPMYSAELTVVLSNLLTNAIKAAGEGGRVRIWAKRDDQGLRIRISNTGSQVDLAQAEHLFRPFVSTTVRAIDPILGQGMGLGLPITRSIIEDYKGSIAFVKPRNGYATTIAVSLP